MENAEIQYLQEKHALELMKATKLKELEIRRTKELGDIESGKLAAMVEAIGRDTLVNLAKAGPELQQKLLGSLGVKSYLIMIGEFLFSLESKLVLVRERE